jgi:hypothetical protein
VHPRLLLLLILLLLLLLLLLASEVVHPQSIGSYSIQSRGIKARRISDLALNRFEDR